ncbi:hypothetical protein ACFW9N_23540 [Streptomyces sp. NPDC059496]|uniref:hypothetical protein n=1 Tax=Streptomyces sp. NPDC059496 TaxID=3346851 RepID=UPI0036BADCA3
MTIRTQKPTRLAVAAAAIPLVLALAGGPVQANAAAPWLTCAKGNSLVYGNSAATVTLTNGEFRFQACRTPSGSLERVKLSYAKKQGPPVEVALAWAWSTRDGKESFIPPEPNGGDHFPVTLSAGQTHTNDFSFAPAGADGSRPAPRFACIEGILQIGPPDTPAKTHQTAKGCF